jgi:uncharacterized YccA/Bax inhibitor family protein
MTSFGNDGSPKKRYGLFIFAILLLTAGGVGLFLGLHNPMVRSLGVAAVMASVYLVRASNVHTRPASSVASAQVAASTMANRPGRLAWIVALALVPLLGVSYLYLESDAIHGANDVTPVYVFAAVCVVCAVVWGYLAARLFSRGS